MIRRPPGITRTAPLFPYPTLFRSGDDAVDGIDEGRAEDDGTRRAQIARHLPVFRAQPIAGHRQWPGPCLHIVYVAGGNGQPAAVAVCPAPQMTLPHMAGDPGPEQRPPPRTEEARVGKGCISPCRTRVVQ